MLYEVITCLTLASPNFFSKKRVLDHYGDLIAAELSKVAGSSCRFIIEVSATNTLPRNKANEDFQLSLPNMNLRPHTGRFLRKDFTFDHFVVGGSNDFAYSASLWRINDSIDLHIGCSLRNDRVFIYVDSIKINRVNI